MPKPTPIKTLTGISKRDARLIYSESMRLFKRRIMNPSQVVNEYTIKILANECSIAAFTAWLGVRNNLTQYANFVGEEINKEIKKKETK